MVKVTGLRASPLQDFTINDPNGGGPIAIILYFRPRVQAWFMDISFKTFSMNGYKLTAGPNILQSYSNVIPFGFGVASMDGLDPFLVDDFVSGRISLYILTTAEVSELDALIKNGTVTG